MRRTGNEDEEGRGGVAREQGGDRGEKGTPARGSLLSAPNRLLRTPPPLPLPLLLLAIRTNDTVGPSLSSFVPRYSSTAFILPLSSLLFHAILGEGNGGKKGRVCIYI